MLIRSQVTTSDLVPTGTKQPASFALSFSSISLLLMEDIAESLLCELHPAPPAVCTSISGYSPKAHVTCKAFYIASSVLVLLLLLLSSAFFFKPGAFALSVARV